MSQTKNLDKEILTEHRFIEDFKLLTILLFIYLGSTEPFFRFNLAPIPKTTNEPKIVVGSGTTVPVSTAALYSRSHRVTESGGRSRLRPWFHVFRMS